MDNQADQGMVRLRDHKQEYVNMLTAIIDLLDGAKYLWEGDRHEQQN